MSSARYYVPNMKIDPFFIDKDGTRRMVGRRYVGDVEFPARGIWIPTSRYTPHQGKKEMARRLRQRGLVSLTSEERGGAFQMARRVLGR